MIVWSVDARNLPEHATNPIHTDAGARAAGFERALVAGVTSYAYCLHPVVEHFGLEWVGSGVSEVRFRSPVFDGDHVSFDLDATSDNAISVSAHTDRSPEARVVVRAWRSGAEGSPPMNGEREGERLEPVQTLLVGEFGPGYASRAGDDLLAFDHQKIVHPAVWTALANRVFHTQVVRGSWIHTRSVVHHHGFAYEGETATTRTTVVERFFRSGTRAVADVVITVGNRPIATIEHEAIIDLSGRDTP